MNIPNVLTLIRFFLVPIFVYSFYKYPYNHYLIPLLIFIIAGITDILDGYIARKYNMVTKWGKLLDPLADKAMQVSALFVLYVEGFIDSWIIIIVFAKELFLIIGSTVLYKKHIVVQANWYGKITTILFYLAIGIIIISGSEIGNILLIIAVIATLYAAIKYTIQYSKATNSQGALIK